MNLILLIKILVYATATKMYQFILTFGLGAFRVLKNLKNTYVRRGALTTTNRIADAVQTDQKFSLSELRAAICHVLLTSEPQLCSSLLRGDQRAQTYVIPNSVSGEEMIFQVQTKKFISKKLKVTISSIW